MKSLPAEKRERAEGDNGQRAPFAARAGSPETGSDPLRIAALRRCGRCRMSRAHRHGLGYCARRLRPLRSAGVVPQESSAIRDGAIAALVASLVIGWFFVAKAKLFAGLEYTSDLFSHVELARNWLRGRPLAHENHFGAHFGGHAYYFDLALGPFVAAAGAYGLFAAHGLLLLGASIEATKLLRPMPLLARLAVAFGLLLGPISFWLFDDPIYGWHAELLFLPLSIFFVSAFRRGSRWRWFWALCIVLVREEGAVVACAIHLVCAWGDEVPFSRPNLLRSVRICLVWLAVFLAGVALLTRDSLSSGRLQQAELLLSRALTQPPLRVAFSRSGMEACLLFLTGAVLVPRSRWLATAAAVAPLVAVIALGSAIYASSGPNLLMHGFAWPPRFVMFWSIACAAAASRPTVRSNGRVFALAPWLLVAAASVAGQAIALRALRGEDVWSRLSAAFRGDGRLLAGRLSHAERSFLACLRASIPHRDGVVASGGLFGCFDGDDLIWPDGTANALHGFQFVVCEMRGRLPFDYGCAPVLGRSVASGFVRVDVEGISAAFDPASSAKVAACLPPSGDR